MQTRLPLVLLSKYQGTDYTKTDRTNLPLESFLKHQETDYKYADKSSTGTPLEAPRDRLHQEHRSLLLAPLLAKYQETSDIDNKQVFSWNLFSEHQETDYTRDNDRQLIAFLWVSFRNTPGDRLTNTYKSSSGTSCSVPRDRLRGDIKALPWHSFQRNYQGTSYIKTDEPSHGTQSWKHA